MSAFSGSEQVWSARLGNLRNAVRQHVIADQITRHLHDVATVLDVGCGQGTQPLRLAQGGLTVTVSTRPPNYSARWCGRRQRRPEVRAIEGDVQSLADTVSGETFGLVCAHGLLVRRTQPGCGRVVRRAGTDRRTAGSAWPEDVDLEACLAAEVQAGRRDPYRRFGSTLHFIARTPGHHGERGHDGPPPSSLYELWRFRHDSLGPWPLKATTRGDLVTRRGAGSGRSAYGSFPTLTVLYLAPR